MYATDIKLKATRSELEQFYQKNKAEVLGGVNTTLNDKKPKTLAEITTAIWKNGTDKKKFPNIYLLECCVVLALTDLYTNKEIEKINEEYRKK